MTDKKLTDKKITEIPIDQIIAKAESFQVGPDTYANHVRLSITMHELILDLYRISGPPGKNIPIAWHLQRIILPQNIAKGLASALCNSIIQFQRETNIQLNDMRGKLETDEMDLWKV